MQPNNPKLAGFDWRRFGHELALKHRSDGRGLRAIGAETGVTASDLSRAMGGQPVAVNKVIALSGWLGLDIMDFYLPPLLEPMKTGCCTGPNVKHREAAE